jgi:hypothetical protein
MSSLLEKIAWKTRRWNFEFSLFKLVFKPDGIGFDLIHFVFLFRKYNFFSLYFRLPNKTTVKKFVVDSWDFLFLYNFLYERWDKLAERALWNKQSLSNWDRIQLRILNKIV